MITHNPNCARVLAMRAGAALKDSEGRKLVPCDCGGEEAARNAKIATSKIKRALRVINSTIQPAAPPR